MNEQPKSIWRRSWKGPLGFFLWVISFTIVISIIALAVTLNDGTSFGRAITISSIAGLVTACFTSLVLLVVTLIRWFFRWRNLRKAIFVLVCLATLLALFYAEENLRGKYAWKKFKTEWAAKGKRFDLASLAPPPVADDQNFAMAPPLVESIGATLGRTNGRAWYGARMDALPQTNFIPRLQVPWPTALYDITDAGGWQKGKRFDLTRGRDGYYLKKWREYFETNGLYQMVIFAIQNPGNTNYPRSMIDPSTGLPLIGAPQDETNTSSPDETNDWLIFDPTTGIISGYRLPAATNVFPLPAEPQPGDDLRTWQRYYLTFLAPLGPNYTNFFSLPDHPEPAAAHVLESLSQFDSAIEELREASRLPYARFPVGYNDANPCMILLPQLAELKRCTQILQLRAVAELQSGQTEKVLDDIKLMLRLTESSRTEPFMISHLVRISIVQLLLQPVWEGLADHRWTDAQLATLDAELGKLDFLADYDLAMQGELACAAGTLDYFRRTRKLRETVELFKDINSRQNASATNLSDQVFVWLGRFGPGGWFDHNKVACGRVNVNLLGPIVNRETHTVSPASVTTATKTFHEIRLMPCNWLARVLFPNMFQCPEKFAYGQWSVDAARIACALERYRLAHGNYPETLDVLAPRFLRQIPHDLINGQPLRYRRAFADRFILYSVGWNETDDGGKIVFKEEARSVDRDQGDWVWQMPDK